MSDKYLLSICIPTYNRLECLENCLDSINNALTLYFLNIEVCILDNNPEGNAKCIAEKYFNRYPIKYKNNSTNIGVGNNILNVVDYAEGKYSWILGNDDMLLPHTFKKLDKLFKVNNEIEYYFINSYSAPYEFILNRKGDLDIEHIENKLIKFSNVKYGGVYDYIDLINYKVSWDFMLGIFLSIFNTSKWRDNKSQIDIDEVSDNRFYTNKYNTFPHLYIFSKAFMNSKAYIQNEPLSINLVGKREWISMYPFVEVVRIPQVLDLYRDNGMPLFKYLIQKNYAMRRFMPGMYNMIFNSKYNGLKYINIKKDLIYNIFFPSIYYYGIYYLFLKIFKILHIIRK